MRDIALIIYNIRSAHNVGSLLRTADGLGINEVILVGYTPYPETKDDDRLPNIARRVSQRIHKTALGAEQSVRWRYSSDIKATLRELKRSGYQLAGLEQSGNALPLDQFAPAAKVALLVGSETDGLDSKVLAECDVIVEIPMHGQKESFNVSVAAAIALYHLSLLDKPPA